jgi:hypothetical protein
VTTMPETPKGLTEKLYWRRSGGQWHCFKRLDQGAATSHSAIAGKSILCKGRRSLAPKLTSVVGCVMAWKRSGAGGHSPGRFRPGGAGVAGASTRRFRRARWRLREATRPRTPLQPNSRICVVDGFRLQFRPRFRQRVFGLAMVRLFHGVGGVEWQARRHTRG